jgi:tetratricopeptide (TPR) repeat protein
MAKKKKKKLNKKFLIALGSVVVLGAGATGYYVYAHAKQDPTKYVLAGKHDMEEKNYAKAVTDFGTALSKNNSDPSLWIMIGDALDAQASLDPENYVKARQAWERALELDATNVDALRRLVTRVQQEVELMPRPAPAAFTYIREKARALAIADPSDSNAKAAGPIAGIQAALNGSQPDPRKLEDDMTALRQLMTQDPANADIPFYLARATLLSAADASRVGNKEQMEKSIAEVEAIFERALKSQPENAAMYFRAAQTANFIAILTQPAPRSEQSMETATKRAETAYQLVQKDPTSNLYLDVSGYYAKLLARRGDAKKSEEIYRKLIAERPNEIVVRLALSDLLVINNRREEAIKMLNDIPQQTAPLAGPRGALVRNQRTSVLLNMANLQLDSYLAESDEQKRKAIISGVEDTLAKVSTVMGAEFPAVLRVRGKMELYRGNVVPAIQTLSKALNLMDETDTGRYETIYLLARGYAQTQQTGEARRRLQQIVDRLPNYFEARLELAQLLVSENDFKNAKPHIDVLAKLRPENPAVVLLVLRTLDPEKDTAQIDTQFAKLPETRRQDRIAKAQVGAYLHKDADATRLLQSVLKENPADVDASVALTRLQFSTGQKAQAVATLSAAIEKNPQNPALKALRETLTSATPDEARAKKRALIDQIADPFERELTLYDFYLQDQDYAQAMPHLQAAAKIKPDEPRVLEQLFQYQLTQQQWDDAAKAMEKLAKADVDHIGGRSFKFRLAAAKGDIPAASSIAEEAIKNLPEMAQSWLISGEALQAQHRYEEALASYQRTLEKQAQNVDAYRGMVECYYALARPLEAKKLIDQGRTILPNNDLLKELSLQHETKYGDPLKVLPEREQMLARNPAMQSAYRNLGDAYLAASRAKQTAGDAAAEKDFLQKARDTYASAVQRWPDDLSLTDTCAELSLQLKNVEAGEQLWKALCERPQFKEQPAAIGGLADYYRRAGRVAEAEKTLRDFLAQHPNAGMQLQLADLLSLQKRDNDAIAVLTGNFTDPRIEQRRIELLIGAKRNDEAKQAIDAAMKKGNAASPDLQLLMAYVELNSGRTAEAAAELDKVLKQQPRNAAALYYRGWLRLREPKKDLDQAIAELTIVRELLPAKMEARYLLAEAYNRKGDSDAAARELEATIRFNPAEKAARLKLAELYATQRPPRWTEVERVLREARNVPQLQQDADLRHAEAVMWMQRKDLERALTSIREALQLAPQNVGLSRTYYDILLAQHDYRGVLNNSDQLLAQKKDLWWAYQARACAWKGLDERDKSLAEFQQALAVTNASKDDKNARTIVRTMAQQLGPDKAIEFVQPRAEADVRWKMVLGYLFMLKQDRANAEQTIGAVLADYAKLSENDQDMALGYASVIYLTLQPPDIEKAKDVYERTLAKHPEDYVTRNNLACLLLTMEGSKPEDVLGYSRQAYEQMQKVGVMEPLILDTYGWANVINGQVPKGIDLLQQALDRQVFEDVLYHLGEAHLKLQPPKAREAEKYLLRAQEMADRLEGTGQRTDPPLKPKIEAALLEARRLIRQGPSETPAATQAALRD